MLKKIGILILAASLAACASYPTKTKSGLEAFEHRDFVQAEEVYREGADTSSVDQLLYLFDRATVYHTSGNYNASIKDLLFADRLSEIKNYTALATELATIITNDRITQYKGEEFENVLVSTYLALNYALLGKTEDAIVECRRVNRKLERLRSEGKRDYRLNAFAQYLSGVLYEKEKNWNSAYVDYRKAQEIDSTIPFLRKDLLRGALIVDSDSDLTKWKRTYKLNEDDIISAKKSLKEKGALVFILQNGVAPEKVVSSIWPELPEYRKRYNKYKAANIYVNGEKLASTKILYDIEEAAKKNLEQKFATYILKRAAGFAAREIIGNKVAETTNSEGLGALTKIFMFMLSRPDLRSWLTLPQNLQMARIELAPGKHKVSFRLLTSDNIEEVEKIMGEIEIKKPGDIVLLNHRSFN